MEIDIILLGILSGGDFFGYEIMKIFKSVMVDIAEVTTGTLYYKLKKLEREGCLTSTREREGLRPQRLRYSITARGRKEFPRLALENISRDSRPYWSYLSSLFFTQHLPVAETADALDRERKQLELTLSRLKATRSIMKKDSYPFHADLLLEHGLRHLEVDIAWLRKFSLLLRREGSALAEFAFSAEDWRKHIESAPPGGSDR